jgi:hypothetical protein
MQKALLPDLIQHDTERLYMIAGHWWVPPVILATQEAEIRRIVV